MTISVRSRFVGWAIGVGAGAAVLLGSAGEASALVNGGMEAGLVKRTADDPGNTKVGLGWGAHFELAALPMLLIGPYYLHYELAPGGQDTTMRTHDVMFNTVGGRARFMLPLPGSDWKPYAYIGAGYTWVTYPAIELGFDLSNPAARSGGFVDRTGHFIETPIGLGVAYQMLKIAHLSLDVAYRPAMSFGGSAYDDVPSYNQPKSGWSCMLGAALDL